MIYEAQQSHFHFEEVPALSVSNNQRSHYLGISATHGVFFFGVAFLFNSSELLSHHICSEERPEEHGISFFILITRQGKLMRSQLAGSIQTKLLTIFLAGVLIKEHSSPAKRRPRQWDDIHDELGYSSRQEP